MATFPNNFNVILFKLIWKAGKCMQKNSVWFVVSYPFPTMGVRVGDVVDNGMMHKLSQRI